MNKELTKNQTLALNIIYELLHIEAEKDYDAERLAILLHVNSEIDEYKKTKDREKLTICKQRLFNLADIFSKAKSEWEE